METGLAEISTLTWKLYNHEKSSKEWDMAPHSSSTPSSSRRKEKQLEDSLGWILLTPIVQFPPVTRELPFCHIGLFVFLKHKSVFIFSVLLMQDLLTLMTSHWNLHRIEISIAHIFKISLIYVPHSWNWNLTEIPIRVFEEFWCRIILHWVANYGKK